MSETIICAPQAMKTLDLVLKHKWYDMIASGEKREEYRGINWYWWKRLVDGSKGGYAFYHEQGEIENFQILSGNPFKPFTRVRFHRGYTSTTMTFEVERITVGKGREEWGAEPGKDCFVIKLGKKV